MEEMQENPRVTYTTKELLNRLDTKLDIIDSKLDAKVDKGEFAQHLTRLALIEANVDRLNLTETQRNVPFIAKVEKLGESVEVLKASTTSRDAVEAVTVQARSQAARIKWLVAGLAFQFFGLTVAIIGAFVYHAK